MLKYCKVINDETKEVSIGLGNNVDFYKSIGFKKKEVVEVDGRYYLKGFEPEADLNKIKELKKIELKKEVEEKFYAEYPLYKQCNIAIFGTEEERQKFKEFHDVLASEYDRKLEIIDSE